MATPRKCFTNYKVGSPISPQVAGVRSRKVDGTAAKVFQAALTCGLTKRQAAELVAATMAAGATAAQSPLARAVVQVECETKTRSLVMAIRGRNARGKVAA
jgi:hypothetical protein